MDYVINVMKNLWIMWIVILINLVLLSQIETNIIFKILWGLSTIVWIIYIYKNILNTNL
jgi:hypothetical protein